MNIYENIIAEDTVAYIKTASLLTDALMGAGVGGLGGWAYDALQEPELDEQGNKKNNTLKRVLTGAGIGGVALPTSKALLAAALLSNMPKPNIPAPGPGLTPKTDTAATEQSSKFQGEETEPEYKTTSTDTPAEIREPKKYPEVIDNSENLNGVAVGAGGAVGLGAGNRIANKWMEHKLKYTPRWYGTPPDLRAQFKALYSSKATFPSMVIGTLLGGLGGGAIERSTRD